MKKKSSFCLFSSVLRFPPTASAKNDLSARYCPGLAAQTVIMIPPNRTDYKKFFLHNLQLFWKFFHHLCVWKLEHQTELSDEAFIHSLRPFVQRLLGYSQK